VELAVSGKSAKSAVNFYMQFREGFPGAFKTKDDECGGLPELEEVSSGTRFLTVFEDLPKDIRVFVTTRDVPFQGKGDSLSSPKALLVPNASPNGDGGVAWTPDGFDDRVRGETEGVPIVELNVMRGFGFAVWEWVSEQGREEDRARGVRFGVVVATPPGVRSTGVLKVNGSFAPLSTLQGSDPGGPIPRFQSFQEPQIVWNFGNQL